ncbi:MAG: cob(I)yrinic acid a,c-diamide adenosyltransferase [Dehalococcoidia bacterium]|nr:cob(I)yrinic acid a,c-diamide adenosyltransferase [Dehalococcoidia bacterium]
MVKIYTKRGDTGKTGLLYGGRVSKSDPRCEAYGTTDEAVAALGLARALSTDARVQEIIRQAQRELFTVGAELATDPSQYATMQRHFPVTTPSMVERLEHLIDELDAEVHLPRSFIIPGASAASAALDVARTILRRAERRVVGLKEAGLLVNDELLRYINRLSDLLFILARYEDRALPMEKLTADEET